MQLHICTYIQCEIKYISLKDLQKLCWLDLAIFLPAHPAFIFLKFFYLHLLRNIYNYYQPSQCNFWMPSESKAKIFSERLLRHVFIFQVIFFQLQRPWFYIVRFLQFSMIEKLYWIFFRYLSRFCVREVRKKVIFWDVP